jgi:hypothetical protein
MDTTYCTPHGLQNKVKDLLAMLGNSKKGFTNKRKAAEEAGSPARFRAWKEAGFDFVATAEGRNNADRIVRHCFRQAVSKKSHDPVRPPFAKTGEVQMKIHDAIVFCSRVGAYIVMQMGLANHAEELVVDYLLALEATTLKWYKVSPDTSYCTSPQPTSQKSDVPGLQKKLLEATAKWEIELPTNQATIVQHLLTHVLAPKSENGLVLNKGPPHVTGMLAGERMNKTLKSLTKATHGVLEGLARSYGVLLAMELRDVEANPRLFETPTYLKGDVTIQVVDPALQRGGRPTIHLQEGSDMYNVVTQKWEEVDRVFRQARAVRRLETAFSHLLPLAALYLLPLTCLSHDLRLNQPYITGMNAPQPKWQRARSIRKRFCTPGAESTKYSSQSP